MIYPVAIYYVGEGDTNPRYAKLNSQPGYYIEFEDALLETRFAKGPYLTYSEAWDRLEIDD